MLLFVVGGLDCDALNDVIDEGVHDILVYSQLFAASSSVIVMFGLAEITEPS